MKEDTGWNVVGLNPSTGKEFFRKTFVEVFLNVHLFMEFVHFINVSCIIY